MFANWKSILGATPDEEILQSAYRFALSLCHDEHDAEDFVQQASLRLCRKYGRIKNQKLMFTTVRNLFYDRLRRDRIVNFESIEAESAPDIPDDAFDASISLADLRLALDQLDPVERELIYLNKVEGYSASEISKLTGEKRGTILWRLAEAMKKMKAFADQDQKTQPSPPTQQENN
ncbi:MAG: sigma-70 family RNA polymerase sigma factor [Verrucomicrobiota bacterium]